ncbi:unnamed protein product [Withania somnifera]
METAGTLFKSLSDFHCDGYHRKSAVQMIRFSDIEMESLAYISIKDIILESPPLSPMKQRKESWREIPMKEPLLQQAAWAYLQPTGLPEANRSLLNKVKDKCFRLFGCLGGAFVLMFNCWFSLSRKKKKLQNLI